MTWRRIGSLGSFGSIRLMKYGVMSTRNLSGAESPSRSSSVSSRICSISSRSLTRWLSCQRQSFHCSSGMSSHIGARRLTAGEPSGAERTGRVGEVHERRLGGDPGRVLVRDRRLDLLCVHSRVRLRIRCRECIEPMHSATQRMIGQDGQPGPAARWSRLRPERGGCWDRARRPVDDPVRGDAPESGRRLEPRTAGAGDRDHRRPARMRPDDRPAIRPHRVDARPDIAEAHVVAGPAGDDRVVPPPARCTSLPVSRRASSGSTMSWMTSSVCRPAMSRPGPSSRK